MGKVKEELEEDSLDEEQRIGHVHKNWNENERILFCYPLIVEGLKIEIEDGYQRMKLV